MLLPVSRHPSFGPRNWLAHRMVQWTGERRPIEGLVCAEVPEPVLTWLETSNHHVSRMPSVRRRVLRRRAVAASDVATLRTPAQVKPPTVAFDALHAASSAGRHGGVNLIVFHSLNVLLMNRPSQGRTLPAVRRQDEQRPIPRRRPPLPA